MITNQTRQDRRARRQPLPVRRSGRERGQSLAVAVIVLFVLLFIGGVFVGLVARNLINAGRAKDTISAYQLAEAGIRYCDYYLTYSQEGADWRPEPQDPNTVLPNDPDRRWLVDGYTRIPFDQGRALVRVSMKPDPRNPLGKYLRIESVGRSGVIRENDPTTFLNNPAPRLRRELVAYKSIGITDYLRFVTNRFNESNFEAAFGVPPIGVPLWMQFGGLPVRAVGLNFNGYRTPGASFRVNGRMRLLNNTILALDPNNNEAVQVAGPIVVEPPAANDPAKEVARFQNLATTPTTPDPTTLPQIIPSSDPGFTTFGGLLRDDGANPDPFGFARSISRLEPPLIDTPDPANGITRYRQSTRESGLWFGTGPNAFNTGRIGLGAGIYLNNRNDIEQETLAVNGGQSLPSVWLKPGSTATWKGTFYIPPAVTIEFGYPVVPARDSNSEIVPGQYEARPGITIKRGVDSNQQFVDPNGVITPTVMTYSFFIYKPSGLRPVLKLENEYFRTYLRNAQNLSEREIDRVLPAFNGVIFAEGNIRTRGLLPGLTNIPIRRQQGDPDNLTDQEIRQRVNPPSVTVVSDRNIYIEGSLVREAPSSMIALLAKEYVVLNTTMFLSPNKPLEPVGLIGGDRPYYSISTAENAATPPLTFDMLFAEDVTQYRDAQNNQVPLQLLVQHAAPAQNQITYLNLFVNEATPSASGGDALYRFNTNVGPYDPQNLPPSVYVVASPVIGNQQQQSYVEQFQMQLFPQINNAQYNFFTQPGSRNTLRFAVEPTFTGTSGTLNYDFMRAAVVPMDVRIEAVMYAQNGSFFIIPGYPFNWDKNDTRDAALRRAALPNLDPDASVRPPGTSDFMPFYGEPINCRITIVGAIAENRTASIAQQAAWMQLWGYMPEIYGSTGMYPTDPNRTRRIPTAHINIDELGGSSSDLRAPSERNYYGQNIGLTRGLRFLYDPSLYAPYAGYNPDNGQPYRQDDHGRILPPVPRLPVSPGFVFFGEVR